MTAPFFSEIPPDSVGEAHPPAPPAASASLQDGRTDFGIVFIHSRLDDYGLTPHQFRVYAHLARRASSGAAWPAVATIATICQIHPKTVRDALRVLVVHRLITREPRPGKTPLYRLTPAAQWHPPTRITGHPPQSDTPVSNWEPTPPKRIQGYPSHLNGAEGNPIEGHPRKEALHTQPARGLPKSESEALEAAKLAGIPGDFAREQFNRMEAVNWLDGCQRPVRSWPHYLRQRWSKEQSERAERTARAAARPGRNGFVPQRNDFQNSNYDQDPATL